MWVCVDVIFLSLDTMQFYFQLIMYAKVFRLSSLMLAKISDWKINEKKRKVTGIFWNCPNRYAFSMSGS